MSYQRFGNPRQQYGQVAHSVTMKLVCPDATVDAPPESEARVLYNLASACPNLKLKRVVLEKADRARESTTDTSVHIQRAKNKLVKKERRARKAVQRKKPVLVPFPSFSEELDEAISEARGVLDDDEDFWADSGDDN